MRMLYIRLDVYTKDEVENNRAEGLHRVIGDLRILCPYNYKKKFVYKLFLVMGAIPGAQGGSRILKIMCMSLVGGPLKSV